MRQTSQGQDNSGNNMNGIGKLATTEQMLNGNDDYDDKDNIEQRFSTSARLFSSSKNNENDNIKDGVVISSPFSYNREHSVSGSRSKMSASLELSVMRVQQQAEQQRRLADKTTATISLTNVKQQQQHPLQSPNHETDNVDDVTGNTDDTTDAQFLRIRWTDVLLRNKVKDWRTIPSFYSLMSCHRGKFDVLSDNFKLEDTVFLPKGIKLGGSGGNSGTAAENNGENYAKFSVREGYTERKYYTYERLNEKQRLIYNAIVHMNESYSPNERASSGSFAADAQNENNEYGYDPSYMGDVVLIQAPPGTGKTHVLLTVAHQMMESGYNLPHVIIFKHGLIFRYRYCTAGFSVAKFCMYAFGLRSLETFKGLERVVNRLDSVECIINNVLQLTRQFMPYDDSRSTPFEVRGNVLMFDEYTVITKILLLAVLFAGKLHNLKYVFCGDRNQLGCIRSSMHTQNTSSFDIIRSFTNNVFDLDTYVRCGNDDYNAKISLVGRMASDDLLGDRGNAIVAALFLPHMLRSIHRHDTIIMRNHRALSHTIYIETLKHQAHNSADYAFSFWILEKHQTEVQGHHMHDNCYMPNPVYRFLNALQVAQGLRNDASNEERATVEHALRHHVPGKHLPFLVLNVGGVYYYETMSDSSLCMLRGIYFNQRTGEPERITIDLVDENLQPRNVRKLLYRHTTCNSVVFSQHFNYLTNDGYDDKPGPGSLVNFPIYPKFIMTTYMSQGCTISTRVSFNTVDCSYKCLYVMMSRVRSPDSINSVSVPNHFSHLISVLMNFDVTRYDNLLPASEIEDKLLNGFYVMYRYWHEDMNRTLALSDTIHRILDTRIPRQQRSIMLMLLRKQIANSSVPRFYINPIVKTTVSRRNVDHNPLLYHNTMNFMLRYKIVMMGLVQLTQYEASIWLRAFLQRLEISSQFSHKLFSTRDEYSTTSLRFEHLFESDSNYKLLAGMNVEPMSWHQGHSSSKGPMKRGKAQLPSRVAVLFGLHVRRINMAYWQQRGSIGGHKNANMVHKKDIAANTNDNFVGNVVQGISLDTSCADENNEGTESEQQQKNVPITNSSGTRSNQVSTFLGNSRKLFIATTDELASASSMAPGQQHRQMKKFCSGFGWPKPNSSSKGFKNTKRKADDSAECENLTGGKRQKHDEYLAAKDPFSTCKTLTELLVARLNLQ